MGSLPCCDRIRYENLLSWFPATFSRKLQISKVPRVLPLSFAKSRLCGIAWPCAEIVEPRNPLCIYLQQVPEHHAEALKARRPSKILRFVVLSESSAARLHLHLHPRCHAATVTNFGNPPAARSPTSFGNHKVHGPIYLGEDREMGSFMSQCMDHWRH